MSEELRNCPDCGVAPGSIHKDNCDVERCSVCGGQYFGCGCEGHDKAFARWTGIWPNKAEAEFLGIDLNTFSYRGYDQFFNVKPKKYIKACKVLKIFNTINNMIKGRI